MKHLLTLFGIFLFFTTQISAQTPLTEAVDISVKTLDSEIIDLFPLLDEGKIVVIDFFSTSCGPCQTFAHDLQVAYENFGMNQGNVFFLGINYNSTNQQVMQFDTIYGITVPSASGLEGGGNAAFEAFEVVSYPTVIVITPDHQIVENFIWEPTAENITAAVVNAGGILVGQSELAMQTITALQLYPNPAQSAATLAFQVEESSQVEIAVTDLQGRTLNVYHVAAYQGRNTFSLPLSDYNSGTYLVTLLSEKSRSLPIRLSVQ